MSEPAAELRQLVATEHALDPEAAKLLVGSTLSELDESATALAKLLGDRREELPMDFFTAAVAAKHERKRSLVNLLTGRPQQPRDEGSRFASGGFDGGARPQSPRIVETHDQTITRLLHTGEANAGGHI